MSAYKKLNKQDAYITTYTARKSWALVGAADIFARNITYRIAAFETLNGIQQLYYPKKSDGNVTTHSFDYYDQTTLFYSSSRNLSTGSFILSIPRQIYGTHIQPGSFSLTIPSNEVLLQLPVTENYITTGYLQRVSQIKVVPTDITSKVAPIVITPVELPPATYTYLDDKEGNIYLSGSSPQQKVGDIIYTHGMVIVTNISHAGLINSIISGKGTRSSVLLNLQSNQPIFTHNYHCKLRESEFNFTYNPSALTSSLKTTYDNNGDIYATSSKGSSGYLNNNVTGSSFQPYITTVGLYNDTNELIAVGKMAQPVPKSANTEMTFIVKIDI